VVVKDRFDCWQSGEFTDFLDRYDIDGLVVCGVELVCCVLYAVLGAAERGYHYLVPPDQPDRIGYDSAAILARWRR
jgi:nicotinamidase-related amidase